MLHNRTIVCIKCGREYLSWAPGGKNGVVVREMFQKEIQVQAIYRADIWACPGCGARIIKGFGACIARHYDGLKFRQALAEWDRAKERGEAYTVWEKGKPE